MALSRLPGRSTALIIGLGTMVVLALLVGGCTQQSPTPPVTQITPASPATTPAAATSASSPAPTGATTVTDSGGKKMVTFTESDDGKTGEITQNTRFAVELAENPTTGFFWNATLSPGLELQSSDFRQSPGRSRHGRGRRDPHVDYYRKRAR